MWKGREKTTKIWISWEWKELFQWSKNHFLSFLKGYSLFKKNNLIKKQGAQALKTQDLRKLGTTRKRRKLASDRVILHPSSTHPSRNNTCEIVVKKLNRSSYQRFLFLSNFAWFLYFFPSILAMIVGKGNSEIFWK